MAVVEVNLFDDLPLSEEPDETERIVEVTPEFRRQLLSYLLPEERFVHSAKEADVILYVPTGRCLRFKSKKKEAVCSDSR
jgi:hypothetical protein